MRRVFAILFMLLLTAQFVQVVQAFAPDSYTIVLNEEQKESVRNDEAGTIADLPAPALITPGAYSDGTRTAPGFTPYDLSHPYLATPTPPPNFAC